MTSRLDFFSEYLAYNAGGETPAFFHRWSAIAGIGAYLERSAYIQFGHSKIYPNIYSMLIGNPGTRKSTAIKTFKKILVAAGYGTIAASKTTKEKFMMDLAGIDTGETGKKDFLDEALFPDERDAACCFIMADEFNDFFGNNGLEFVSLLGSLWDWDGPYENRIKNGKSFIIPNPTISILGGNTPTGFSTAFPPEIIGQGFFSRILLIYGEPTGVRIAFPKAVPEEETFKIVTRLQQIKAVAPPVYDMTPEARKLLETIYEKWQPISDVRFESYSNRRFIHLLKLCIIQAASALHSIIEVDDVICANTVLTHTEHLMPKALGEFGRAKHADVAQKIMQMLDAAPKPLNSMDIWEGISNDLDNQTDLSKILSNLGAAGKIQSIEGKGFLPKRKRVVADTNELIDMSYLTDGEWK